MFSFSSDNFLQVKQYPESILSSSDEALKKQYGADLSSQGNIGECGDVMPAILDSIYYDKKAKDAIEYLKSVGANPKIYEKLYNRSFSS